MYNVFILIKKITLNMAANVKQKTNVRPKPEQNRILADDVAGFLLKAGSPTWLDWLVGYKQSSYIVGSYIYKHLLRSEKITDVDTICKDTNSLLTSVKSVEETAYNPELPWKYDPKGFSMGMTIPVDYNAIHFLGISLTVDLIGFNDYVNRINTTGLCLSNCLVLSPKGIQHVFEIPELSKDLNLEAIDPIKERDWAIQKIKAGQYCKWQGMREKDVDYFKNWKIIDFQECEAHGMFNKKN